MKILGQRLSDGSVTVVDAPAPMITEGQVRVKAIYSAISAGTEGGKVIAGKMSLLEKAKSKPAQTKQVIDMAKAVGIKTTYLKVKSKLEGAQPLGYSLCGEVTEILGDVGDIKIGDLVACAGGGANHADEVVVSKNLVVKLPQGVDPKSAAFTTIASISLQGIRLAQPTLGESALVIGLGIVGQFAAQFLKASGCRVFGTDLDENQLQLAIDAGTIDAGGVSGRDSIESLVSEFTRGRGADMTIICAGTSSNQPVEFAGEVTRKKGRIVVVGAVNMNLPRESFFKKELSFAVSCSYGPGRYDPSYEEEGKDYPYPYVRWTEGRNMEAVLDGMARGEIDPRKYTTHVFPIQDSPDAYEIIAQKKESFCGMLIKYPDAERKTVNKVELIQSTKTISSDIIGIGVVGPGSFAQTALLPPLKSDKRIYFSSVCTRSGLTASDIGDRLGFRRAVGSIDEMLKDKETNAVVVATRHNTHAEAVLKSIGANKAVFVEKPLCIAKEELKEIVAKQKEKSTLVQVGFNRRFSKAAVAAKKFMGFSHPPLTMMYRISAGHIPKEHWTQTEEGGGRILGEVCHFIDLLQFFADSNPVSVHAYNIDTTDQSIVANDNTIISIKFADGSIGSIGYFAEGGKSMAKERCEIIGGNRSAVIDNFTKVEFYSKSRKKTKKFSGKGHSEEMVEFVTALKTGTPAISMDSQIATTLASFAVLESLETGAAIKIDTGKI